MFENEFIVFEVNEIRETVVSWRSLGLNSSYSIVNVQKGWKIDVYLLLVRTYDELLVFFGEFNLVIFIT